MKYSHHTSYGYPSQAYRYFYDDSTSSKYILKVTLSDHKRSDKVTEVCWVHCIFYPEYILFYFSDGYRSIISGTPYLFLPRDQSRSSAYRMCSHNSFRDRIHLPSYHFRTLQYLIYDTLHGMMIPRMISRCT